MRSALLVISLVALVSCSKQTLEETKKVEKEKVNLPPRPNLTAKKAPEKYQDGAYSVEGAIRHAKELLGKEVSVRGSILEVVRCDPNEKPCRKMPHFIMVDDLTNPKRKLPVIGDPPESILVGYDPGTTQTISGQFGMWSNDGRMVSLDGLLIVKPPNPNP